MRFRRGYMLGDGTGAGKGRQSAGIVLDNWLKGRRKAVWISKSDKLLEDAQRGRAAAESWLEDHRRSVSWRLTRPLRAVKRRVRFASSRAAQRRART